VKTETLHATAENGSALRRIHGRKSCTRRAVKARLAIRMMVVSARIVECMEGKSTCEEWDLHGDEANRKRSIRQEVCRGPMESNSKHGPFGSVACMRRAGKQQGERGMPEELMAHANSACG
jgi:hypothetical protein